jgi:hypothetical protein
MGQVWDTACNLYVIDYIGLTALNSVCPSVPHNLRSVWDSRQLIDSDQRIDACNDLFRIDLIFLNEFDIETE